jgi:hypothetical protein
MKKLLIMSFLLLIALWTNAQDHHRSCGTMAHLQHMLEGDPEMQGRMDQIESFTNDFVRDFRHINGQAQSTITIPVVVHVVYNNTTQNISDTRIYEQIAQLNRDFSATNSDVSLVPSAFTSLVANTGIQFCLAQRDPNGNATNGILRVPTTRTSFGTNNDVKFTSKGGSDAWPRDKYLNIWVCNLGNGLLGYAQFPGGTAATDGVVVLFSSVGGQNAPGTATPYHLGRTLTHEVGHWLNLRHIWGDATCGNDYVNDTPTQQTSNTGCPSFPKVTCSNGPNGDMFMNYMDYTNDACMYMLTMGQSARMNALFGLGGARASLLNSDGCVPPSAVCGTPANLSAASVTTSGATISWTPVSGAGTYNVQYKLGSSGTWTNVSTTSASITLTGLSASSTYNIQVQAVCSASNSSYSAPISFTTSSLQSCATPTGLAASNITTTTATITWTAVSGAASYNLDYKLSSSSTWSTFNTTSTSVNISGMTAATSYDFRVQTVCSGSSSTYSATISLTTQSDQMCGVPGNLAVSSITASGATVSWAAVSNAASYNIQYKLSTASTWTSTTSTTTSKVLSGLTASASYNVQVQAVCSFGSSAFSSPVNFTTASASCTDIYESNNSISKAQSIPLNTTIQAMIGTATDLDHFKFKVTSSARNFLVLADNFPQDYDVNLYRGTTLIYSSKNRGTTPEAFYLNNASTSVTYTVRVYGYNGVFDNNNCYNLRVSTSSTAFSRMDASIAVINHGEDDIRIYPNPAKNTLTIEAPFESAGAVRYEIYDLTGRKVYDNNLPAEKYQPVTIDISSLHSGMYILRVEENGLSFSKKFTIYK